MSTDCDYTSLSMELGVARLLIATDRDASIDNYRQAFRSCSAFLALIAGDQHGHGAQFFSLPRVLHRVQPRHISKEEGFGFTYWSWQVWTQLRETRNKARHTFCCSGADWHLSLIR